MTYSPIARLTTDLSAGDEAVTVLASDLRAVLRDSDMLAQVSDDLRRIEQKLISGYPNTAIDMLAKLCAVLRKLEAPDD